MLRHLGLIAVCACIVASVGCDGGKLTAPAPSPMPSSPVADPNTTVTVEFGGRVVNADAGGPVESVRVSVDAVGSGSRPTPAGWVFPKDTATSGGDGTFTLPLNLPSFWTMVGLKFTGPAGYDDTRGRFEPTAVPCKFAPCWAAADRPAIRMYPTLVIRPGESIEVRVESGIVWCGWDGVPCRRVLVAASPGDPVELEVVPDDSSKPMALMPGDPFLEPDMSVRRLMVPPGGFPYVLADLQGGPGIGAGTARLTARR
jgi:hypothetical protein